MYGNAAIWLNDTLPMPQGFHFHAKTAREAINLLQSRPCSHISFNCEETAKWIRGEAYINKLQRLGWSGVSKDIEPLMLEAEQYWGELEKKFYYHLNKFNDATCHLSNRNAAAENEHHKAIVAMGKPVVGVILRYIHHEPDHLFHALCMILGEEPEIPDEMRGKVDEMCEEWYKWGQKQGYTL
jgi:hypothetical protein